MSKTWRLGWETPVNPQGRPMRLVAEEPKSSDALTRRWYLDADSKTLCGFQATPFRGMERGELEDVVFLGAMTDWPFPGDR